MAWWKYFCCFWWLASEPVKKQTEQELVQNPLTCQVTLKDDFVKQEVCSLNKEKLNEIEVWCQEVENLSPKNSEELLSPYFKFSYDDENNAERPVRQFDDGEMSAAYDCKIANITQSLMYALNSDNTIQLLKRPCGASAACWKRENGIKSLTS